MSETISSTEAFLQVMEDRAVSAGSYASLGRILGVIVLGDKGLNQQEIADLSGYTKAHVSKVLQQLVKMGSVKKAVQASNSPGRPSFIYELNLKGDSMVYSGVFVFLRSLQVAKYKMQELKRGKYGGKSIERDQKHDQIIETVDKFIEYVTQVEQFFDEMIKKFGLELLPSK